MLLWTFTHIFWGNLRISELHNWKQYKTNRNPLRWAFHQKPWQVSIFSFTTWRNRTSQMRWELAHTWSLFFDPWQLWRNRATHLRWSFIWSSIIHQNILWRYFRIIFLRLIIHNAKACFGAMIGTARCRLTSPYSWQPMGRRSPTPRKFRQIGVEPARAKMCCVFLKMKMLKDNAIGFRPECFRIVWCFHPYKWWVLFSIHATGLWQLPFQQELQTLCAKLGSAQAASGLLYFLAICSGLPDTRNHES